MMKTFIKIILFLLFSNCAFAYCDFELIKMERSLKEFSSKTKFIPTDENFSNDLVTFPLPVEEVCTDKDFIMFPVHFTFINKKLHQIYKGLSTAVVSEAFGWDENFRKKDV